MDDTEYYAKKLDDILTRTDIQNALLTSLQIEMSKQTENIQETQTWIQSIQKQIEDEKMKSDELEALKIATQEDLQNSSQAYQQQKIKDAEITR